MLYLFQVSIIFSILYAIYSLLFSRLTFHNTNRIVLLVLMPLSLAIPFSEVLTPSMTNSFVEIPLFEAINTESFSVSETQLEIIKNTSINYKLLLSIIYSIGCFICLIKFYLTNRKLFLLKRHSKNIKTKEVTLVFADVPNIFSYFHWVFIPKKEQDHYNNLIIEHEKTHVRLKHSVDLIIVACYIIFFWFNPFVYLFRKTLKAIHEYQADQGVLTTNVKTSQYLQLLANSLSLKKTTNLHSYFNHPIIKKRIKMMTQHSSKSALKLSYILLLPICFVLMSAFTTTSIQPLETIQTANTVTIPPSFIFPIKNGSKKDISSFFGKTRKLPKNVTKEKHGGIDIRANVGTPILAAADGTIIKSSMEGNWGNLIIIKHKNGFETWYAHLRNFNTLKSKQVKKGDVIGYVGVTGKTSGPHLHFEVKHNNKRVNPLKYLE